VIYFIQSLDGGPVKIGYSKDVDSRRSQLEYYYGRPLALLATIKGGRDKEREIHERFSHLRLERTELFRPTVELMEFIGRPLLVGANPNTVEILRPRRSTGMVRVDIETLKRAKLAASLLGIPLIDYVSQVLMKASNRDILREARKLTVENRE
jgi:hypothetical protein